MPVTPAQLFAKANAKHQISLPWKVDADLSDPGVYIVSQHKEPAMGTGRPCELAPSVINAWRGVLLTAWTKDSPPLPSDEIQEHLARWWLPNESILYIGKAGARARKGGLSKRIDEMFTHLLGCDSPHAGGHWLHTLANRHELWVHYATTPGKNPETAEDEMLEEFCNLVKATLKARNLPSEPPDVGLPFANQKDWLKRRRQSILASYTVPCPRAIARALHQEA